MKLIEKVRYTASRLKTMARRPSRKLPPQKLQARVRASVAATADHYDDEEPQTKLTSAFVVVLILHVVAVGGIYAFNQIKASRRSLEAGPSAPQVAAKSSSGSDSVEQASTQPAANTASVPATAGTPSRPRNHQVKPGDNLTSIAKQYATSVPELKAANSLSTDSIRQGHVLILPAPTAKPLPEVAQSRKPEQTEVKPVSATTYTVKSGDRLIFIAKKFKVTPEELILYNKISDPTKVQIGQTLKIPAKK